MRWMVGGVVAVVLLVSGAQAEVLCVRAKKDGTLSGAIKVRTACKRREVQVDGPMLGLCCDPFTTTSTLPGTSTSTSTPVTTTITLVVTTTSTSTVTTTSNTCPPLTTTTFQVNGCGGSAFACNGFCSNLRQCVTPDGISCQCVGPLLACGGLPDGTCGGECPVGQVCTTTISVGGDGCPSSYGCACLPPG